MRKLLAFGVTIAATLVVALLSFGNRGPGTSVQAAPPAAAPVAPDGLDDVFFIDDAGHNFVSFSDGDGTFTDGEHGSGGSPFYWDVFPGHFNNDGLTDLLLYHADDGIETILIANGDGVWTQKQNFYWPTDSKLIVGDFNGDGLTDVWRNSGSLSDVQFAVGDGTWNEIDQPPPHKAYSGFSSYAVGRFNSDTRDDIFVYYADTRNEGLTLYANGTGGWTEDTQPAPFNGDAYPIFTAGDFNGDGLADLVEEKGDGQNTSNTFKIYFKNTGDGFAETHQSITYGNRSGVLVGDFTGNGKDDIFLYSNFLGGTSYVYDATSDGGFSQVGQPTDFPGKKNLVVGHFNSDNKADIFFYVSNGDSYIWFANGNGSWTTGPTTPITGSWDATIGDYGTSPNLVTPPPTQSPAQSASPTPTHSPSPTPTHSPQPTASGQRIQGDLTCDGFVTVQDMLALLKYLGTHDDNPTGCLDAQPAGAFANVGDINCDGFSSGLDALDILRHVANLSEVGLQPSCPLVGSTILD